ncbi:hypothetical protein PPERSA_02832 [Pseudocohnilembus persalinus]|uniref:Amidinotransferase n=1 Tax=Pseudocohnilembus persalinus TaxID=266149 RepID=A0A0V0QMK6_PSEPJ|nr:hypothetical protein PPERSA_02832 [Pseudocohnilembus persalinus]|eukprot:KRX03453.1 hypothetical protein PPERSA_02832 [Pseudocohnilembus persalinus]
MNFSNNNQNTATSILMIKPVDFQYNQETATDNEFMNKTIENTKANKEALKEFDKAVKIIQNSGVNVLVFDKNEADNDLKEISMPDAVFPNNWISTDTDNAILLYQMMAKNRNYEKHQFRYIAEMLSKQFVIDSVVNFSYKDQILEGTGSLLIDRVKRRAYCSRSKRAEQDIFEHWCRTRNYEGILFDGFAKSGTPIYHTNVLLSIGEKFAVFCADTIKDEQQRKFVVEKLKEDRELILISQKQVEEYFCGNILEVANQKGEKQIFMSQRAYDGFTKEQIETLSKYGKLNPVPLYNIEEIGGGSMRCMMAEIFLQPKKQESQ